MEKLKQLLIENFVIQSLGQGYSELYHFPLREEIREFLDEILDTNETITYRDIVESFKLRCSDFQKRCMKCYFQEDDEKCELKDWLIILSYILEEIHTLNEVNQTQAFYNCLYRRWSSKFIHVNPRIIFEYYILNRIEK